jgi:hypothetical protein
MLTQKLVAAIAGEAVAAVEHGAGADHRSFRAVSKTLSAALC